MDDLKLDDLKLRDKIFVGVDDVKAIYDSSPFYYADNFACNSLKLIAFDIILNGQTQRFYCDETNKELLIINPKEYIEIIKNTPKKAHWIKKMEVTETETYTSYDPKWYCSCCNTKYEPSIAKHLIIYCHTCGSKMCDLDVEEKEEEDADTY